MTESLNEIRFLLDEKYNRYNHVDFIETDPIQIPHQFGKKEDIEIAGFLTATIAWGQRTTIINNARKLMKLMDNSPYDFVINSSENEQAALQKFVHRTFNGDDCLFFIHSLRNIYLNHGGLETVFSHEFANDTKMISALVYFRKIFIEISHAKRSEKHLSDVSKNSSAKRLNMYLRWMVRNDQHGVDFGLWRKIPTSALMLPLDVHTGDVGRALGLLHRQQNDWKAVEEITEILRKFDPDDPIKYDFSLFGMGAFENKKEEYKII